MSVFTVKTLALLIDPCSAGLLLSRTWVFTGRKKLVAWVFSILLLSYSASSLWADVNFMKLYKGPHYRPSPELCLQWLAAARHGAGVGVTYNTILCILAEYNFLSSLF